MKFLPWLIAVLASALSFWGGTKWQAKPVEPAQSSAKSSQTDATGASAANPARTSKAGLNPATATTAHSSVVGPPDSEEESRSPAERVRLAFKEKNEFRRLQLFHRALAKMTAADAREVEDLFIENDKAGKYHLPEFSYFTRRWGEVDGPGAMAFATVEWQKKDYMGGIIAQMMGGWATQQPQQATEWINQNENVPDWMRTSVISGLIEGLAKIDVEQARRLVEDRLDDPGKDKYLSVLADEYIYTSGIDRADAWFDSLPANVSVDSRRRLSRHMVDRHSRAGPQGAAAYVSRYINESWFDQSAAINVAKQYLRDDPAGAKTWAATLPEDGPVRQWVASQAP